jgi:translation initiation factor 3 subunit E
MLSGVAVVFGRMLSKKLNMKYDDAERWIVNLIRNARLDAKIDSKMGTVVMGTQHPNV